MVRSARRRKTVTAYRSGNEVVVLIPARMSRAQEKHWVATMLGKLDERERRGAVSSDEDLMRRSVELAGRHFEGRLVPRSIRYVDNQRARFGSCTPEDHTIRISRVLADMPEWVRDYVICHEMAHLAHPDHSRKFWDLVGRYPLAERARGYLLAKGLEEEG